MNTKATYPKGPDTILRGILEGPFSGEVKDENGAPISDAWVLGRWTYIADEKSCRKINKECALEETVPIAFKTKEDGRYSIQKYARTGKEVLKGFQLLVYKFGYIGYRSDQIFPEKIARKDFSQTGNTIFLASFPVDISRKDHVLFLGCDPIKKDCDATTRAMMEKEFSSIEKEDISSSPSTTSNKAEPANENGSQKKSSLDAKKIFLQVLEKVRTRGLERKPKRDVQEAFRLWKDVDASFDVLPFPDSIYQVETGENYSGVHLRAKENQQSKEDETKDMAVRIWHPKEAGAAVKLFYDVKTKLGIKTIEKDRSGMNLIAKNYQPKMKFYTVLLLVSDRETVVQLSCGKIACGNETLLKLIVDFMLENIDLSVKTNQSP